MSKFTTITNSFKSGKLSKRLTHRQDIDALKDSCKELYNFIVLPNGSVKRRYGSKIISTPTLTDGSLYTFKYTQDHTYIVQLQTGSPNIFGLTTRTVGQSSSFLRVFKLNGDEIQVRTLANMYLGFANNPWYNTSYDAFDSSVSSCFSQLDHANWQTTQLSRKMVFAHPSGTKMPFVLDMIQNGSSTPSFIVYPWCFDKELYMRNALRELDGGDYVAFGGLTIPHMSLNTVTGSTVTLAHPTGAYTANKVTQFASASDTKMFKDITINSLYYGDPANFIGTSVLIRDGSNNEGLYILVDVTSYSYPTAIFKAICVCEGTTAGLTTYKWALSEWGGLNGFPRAVSTYKGRIVFGGSSGYPNRFWIGAVNTNNPSSFQTLNSYALGQDASSDVSLYGYYGNTLPDKATNASFNEASTGDIKWIRGRRYLHFGTNIGEHKISFLNNTVVLGNMEAAKVTSYSSSPVPSIEGDQKIFYVSNDYTNIRFISTNDTNSESIDTSLSILNQEYDNIKKLEWCEHASCAVFKYGTNKMGGITVNEQSGTTAFFEFNFGFTPYDFIVVDKDAHDNTDGSTLLVLGKLGSTYKILAIPFLNIDTDYHRVPTSIYHYLDWWQIQLTASIVDTTYALFADKTVGYYVNGIYGEVIADSSGVFTIPYEIGDDVVYGLPYDSYLETSQIEEGSKFGKATGLIKRIDRAAIYLTKSGNCYIGANNGSLYPTEREIEASAIDHSPVVEFSNNPDYHISCVVKSVPGQALNISSIAFRGVTYEGE
mgnify:CR=1 FL=1